MNEVKMSEKRELRSEIMFVVIILSLNYIKFNRCLRFCEASRKSHP